jgi:hypothetical protein
MNTNGANIEPIHMATMAAKDPAAVHLKAVVSRMAQRIPRLAYGPPAL